jgi:YggT family protein
MTETETETETVDAETSTVVSVTREAVRMTALGAVGALTWATSVDAANAATAALGQLSGLDPEGAKAASAVLGPLFAVSTILFIVRIVMTWYPSVPYTKLPWVLAYAPTEPLLKPTRALVPPVGGVDVSPIIWVMMISFMNEILLGKQGLLVLLSNKQLGG